MITRDATGWTEQDALDLFNAAKASLASGSAIISWQSSGSSVTRQITDSPGETMAFAQWLLKKLNPELYGFDRSRTVATFNC